MSVRISDAPPYLESIARLDAETRRAILSLLDHFIVKRLRHIEELGYASRVFGSATHSRWEHTLWTVDVMCRLLEVSPVPSEMKLHLLASAVLQDVGHAPFSESLGRIFDGEWAGGTQSWLVPADKSRTIAILAHVETTERFFSRLGLTFDLLVSLVAGRFPWPTHAWAHRLIDGVLDADRLAYVEQDSSLTLNLPVGPVVERLTASFVRDGPANVTMIGVDAVEDAHEFIRFRGSLYADVYHHPRKLALENVMRDVLAHAWEGGAASLDPSFQKPTTVEEFLKWTDARVEHSLGEDVHVPDSLSLEFNRILRAGRLMVGEVQALGGQSMSFGEIDTILESLEIVTFPKALVWVILSKKLGPVSIYEPGSILVKRKDTYQPLETMHESLVSLSQPFRRRPMIIAEWDTMLNLINRVLVGARLTLGQLQPVAAP